MAKAILTASEIGYGSATSERTTQLLLRAFLPCTLANKKRGGELGG